MNKYCTKAGRLGETQSRITALSRCNLTRMQEDFCESLVVVFVIYRHSASLKILCKISVSTSTKKYDTDTSLIEAAIDFVVVTLTVQYASGQTLKLTNQTTSFQYSCTIMVTLA